MSNVAVALDDQVHVGKDGWLFLVKGSNNVIDMYRRKSSFTDKMAREWVELLRTRADRLNARGIEYVHLAAPEKLTLLNGFYEGELEHLPGGPISQLMDRYDWDMPSFLNVVPYLAQNIDKFPVYWKTDTHWSAWGCFLAYQMLCSRLKIPTNTDILNYPFVEGELVLDLGAKCSPAVEEKARFYQLDRHSRRVYANTLVRFKEEHNLIDEGSLHVGSHVIYRNDSPDAADKVVVMFGDSFAEYRNHLLTGMLAETVRELHFIWNSGMDDEYIRQVKPDVVITELAERFMTRIPADNLDIREFAQNRVADFTKQAKAERRDLTPTLPESRITRSILLAQETYQLNAPVMVQPGCDNAQRDLTMKTNAVSLVEVFGPRIYFTGERCLVKAPGGEDIVRYAVDDERETRIRTEEYRRLKGTSMMLAPTAGTHCYYHWMVDILPRLGLLERQGISLDSINHFIVREISGDFQRQTLMRMGIDESRIVETVSDQYLSCDRLLHIEMENAINMKMNRFIPLWLKHQFQLAPQSGERLKLYISRPEGVRRGISNEEELRPHLEAAGFRMIAMEGMTVEEQVALLSRADVLMSPHGGALTNMVFCRPGIKVIELLSRHVYPYYYGLSEMCGHRYHAIMENTDEDYPRLVNHRIAHSFASPEIQWKTHNASFEVSVEAVQKMLQIL
jgi:capsular polysaccharide biosynthesis protein